jgi:protein CpxP
MKKVFALVLMLVGLTTFAQERGEKREQLSSEKQTELQVKKMTLDLDLNEKQQKEIKSILLVEAKKREGQKAEREARKESQEKTSKEERFEMKSKMLDNQIAVKEKMKGILSTDQMKKWEASKENRQEKMKERKRKMKQIE